MVPNLETKYQEVITLIKMAFGWFTRKKSRSGVLVSVLLVNNLVLKYVTLDKVDVINVQITWQLQALVTLLSTNTKTLFQKWLLLLLPCKFMT